MRGQAQGLPLQLFLRKGRGVEAAPFSLVSECTSHLGEYAANRGFSRILRMAADYRILVYSTL